ncbi:MAG: tetratricopeptide repeat protein [Thermodesulfovibrionales bacterium]
MMAEPARRHMIASLAIICGILLAYSNTLNASFHFDDYVNIVENPAIRDFGYFTDPSLVARLDSSNGFNGPLFTMRYVGYLSFALNYAVGGLDVRGYHLVNILIHIASSLLLFRLLVLLQRSLYVSQGREKTIPGAGGSVAIVAAALFAVHPLQTQAVTYIVQRFASLAAMFYLLAMVLYVRWRLTRDRQAACDHAQGEVLGRGGASGRLLYGGSLLAAVLAIKTKEFAVTLPFMMAGIEFLFFGRAARKSALYLAPFFLVPLLVPLSFAGADGILARSSGIDEAAARISGAQGSISRTEYLFTQMRVIVTYLRMLAFPFNQSNDHDHPVYSSLFAWPVALSCAVLAAVLVSAAWAYVRSRREHNEDGRRLRLTAFGMLWFVVTMMPESSIIPINDVMFEHRLYLPSAGVFLAFSCAVDALFQKWRSGASCLRKVMAGMMALMVIALAVATHARNATWITSERLWEDAVRKGPRKARPHSVLGTAYALQNRLPEAIAQFRAAIEIDPADSETHYALGLASAGMGRIEDAIAAYQTAVRLNVAYLNAHLNLGAAYARLGRMEDAAKAYKTAIMIKPDSAQAHNNLGNAYSALGRQDEAVGEYAIALQLKPDLAEAHYNLGNAYEKLGRRADALAEYREALRVKPDFVEAQRKIGQSPVDRASPGGATR